MKKKFGISIFYLIFTLCSCSNTDDLGVIATVFIKEGESKTVQVNGKSLSISIVRVKALFSEGEYTDDGGKRITIYDASINFNDQIIDFRTISEVDSKNNNIEKDWARLEKTVQGIKSFGSNQVGISDLYPENGNNSQDSGKYLIKLLIK